MPAPGFKFSVPKPKYNPGACWCAKHAETVHETMRGCKQHARREKDGKGKACANCVFGGGQQAVKTESITGKV